MFFSPLIGIPSDTIKTNCVSSENETNRDKYRSNRHCHPLVIDLKNIGVRLYFSASNQFRSIINTQYPLLGCPQSSHQDDLSKRFDRQTLVIHQSFSFLERAKEK